MACFKLLGDLLRDCGWTIALSDAAIATSGTAQSFWSCSNTNKTRQAHQVTVCVLFAQKFEASHFNMKTTKHNNILSLSILSIPFTLNLISEHK
jgi:hypothetical protein